MYRRAISVLAAFLLVPLFQSSPANSQDICLAQFPDSAWQNGEPQEVKNLLGYDLVGKKTEVGPSNFPNQFDVLTQGTTNLISTITYEYKGRNCGTRVVLFKQTVLGPKVTPLDRLQWSEALPGYFPDFMTEQDLITRVDKVRQTIKSSSSLDFVTGEKIAATSLSRTLLGNDFQYFFRLAFGSKGQRGVVYATRTQKCYFNINLSGGLEKRFAVVEDSSTKWLEFVDPKVPCEVNVFFYLGQKLKWDGTKFSSVEKPDLLLDLGIVTVSYKPKVIIKKCVKGKKTIIVSGPAPVCPKGFKG